MEIRHLLQVIRRSSRFLAGSAIVACLIAIAATYVLSNKYTATTSILIRPHSEPGDQTAKSLLNYPVSFNIPVDSMSKTYAEIMRSPVVAKRVVDLLHLDTLKPPRDPRWYVRLPREARAQAKLAVLRTWDLLRYGRLATQDPYSEAVDTVMREIHAEPLTDTFLFSLTATAHDPQMAARIANTAADVFIDYMRHERTNEESTGAHDIDTRLHTIQGHLEEARNELQAFGQDTTAASLDRDLQLQLEQLEKFQAEREETIKELDGDEAAIASLEHERASENETVRSSTTVARNPIITQIESALAKLRVEYAGLAATLAPAHPKMRALKAQIDEATERLAAASSQVPDHVTSARNPAFEEVTQALIARTAARDAHAAHLKVLEAAIARYQGQTEGLASQKGDLSRLTFNVDILENEYRLLDREHAEAALAAVQQIPEIRQLGPATPPLYPARPIKIYYAVAGLGAGFLAALLVVLMVDYLDPRVYDVEVLRQRLDVPFVSVVPHLAPGRSDAGLTTGPAARTPGYHSAFEDRA